MKINTTNKKYVNKDMYKDEKTNYVLEIIKDGQREVSRNLQTSKIIYIDMNIDAFKEMPLGHRLFYQYQMGKDPWFFNQVRRIMNFDLILLKQKNSYLIWQ